MKLMKLIYWSMALALGLIATACNNNDVYNVPAAGDGGKVTECSVAEGSTVPYTTTQILLTYSKDMVINSGVSSTLNGSAVTLSYGTSQSGESARNQIVVPVSLSPGESYELVIPARALGAVNSAAFAQEFTLRFVASTPELGDIDPLTNAKATVEAVKTYQLLVDNYGKKMLSGSMGAVAWGTEYADFLNSQTGAYPAIIGFDYIHLAYSPSDWIDYGDITPAKEAWEKGSIPAMSWHWAVPTSSSAVKGTLWEGSQEMPSDWSKSVIMNDEAALNLFAQAEVGDVVEVYAENVASGAQGSFKNAATWGGIKPEYEYFNISGNFTLPIDEEVLADLQSTGLVVTGHDYTATKVVLRHGGGSTLSFSAEGNSFNCANATVAGTWENDVVNADLDKVAGYLRLLQDAGIPVLFRPLHEAAGDYTWGPWFWWGNSGVEATKALWKYLYDKLTKEYGLNNLIWVWTMQVHDAGMLASAQTLMAAYPGAEYVDIVGVDIYPDAPLTDQSDVFYLLNQVVGGKKMVALSECGNLVEPSQALQKNALWSFFMQWYDTDEHGNYGHFNYSGDQWKTVNQNPCVLKRGDFAVK